MALPFYLAMTAAEFSTVQTLPEHMAWMACHFSCYGLGLSNLPQQLPADSMVILNDRTPIHGHDPGFIAGQLNALLESHNPSCILLDFQRTDAPETAELSRVLIEALPCPVGITEHYVGSLDCPVFLPPVPLHTALEEYLKPWQGREIWLEIATEAETITVTAEGATIESANWAPLETPVFEVPRLHCRYHTSVKEDRAVFSLQRHQEHIPTLLEDAKSLGVTKAVGLHQQLG